MTSMRNNFHPDPLDDIVGSIVSTVPTERHLCDQLLRPRRANTDSDVDLYVVTKDAARDPFTYGALVPARRFSG